MGHIEGRDGEGRSDHDSVINLLVDKINIQLWKLHIFCTTVVTDGRRKVLIKNAVS